MENKFIIALRKQLRFDTVAGKVTTEDLWLLPLTSKTRANLNDIAVGLDDLIQKQPRKSFVEETPKDNDDTQLKFDIVLYVIETKRAEAKIVSEAADRKAKREKLLELIDRKENQELENKGLDELRKMASEM